MKNLCREKTLPRCEEASRGWILRNTKISPILDVKVCLHQKRYGIEIMVESLFRDRTLSWVRIVNGIDKYVNETSETISFEIVEHRVTGKPVAKAKPRPMPAVTLSLISNLVRDRNWIGINPERFRQDHDQIPATWCVNSSRRWWSSTIWRYYWKIQGKVRWYSAMAN